jgi:hypothetical protein
MRHPSDYLPAYKAVPKSTRCSTKSSASRPKLELSPPTIFIDTRDQVFAEYAANTRTVNGRPFEQLYASPDTEHSKRLLVQISDPPSSLRNSFTNPA